MKRLIPILLLSAALCACSQKPDVEFLAEGGVRLEINGKAVFTYDPAFCQLSFNHSTLKFCAFTDNTSDYFTMALSSMPGAEGEKISADLVWTTQSSVESRKNVALTLMKREGDILWFSENGGSAAVCIRLI